MNLTAEPRPLVPYRGEVDDHPISILRRSAACLRNPDRPIPMPASAASIDTAILVAPRASGHVGLVRRRQSRVCDTPRLLALLRGRAACSTRAVLAYHPYRSRSPRGACFNVFSFSVRFWTYDGPACSACRISLITSMRSDRTLLFMHVQRRNYLKSESFSIGEVPAAQFS
jgi:hypothetical protein